MLSLLRRLLFGDPSSRLSREQMVALAHELNRPIIEPLLNPPPAGFKSKHNFAETDVRGRLQNIDWFSRCGQPLSCELSMGIEQVASWPEAVESCADGIWEDVELEAQNQLSLWLHLHDHNNYQKWNELAIEHKAVVLDRLTEEKWIPYQQERGLDIVIVHSVQWNVLGALMENSYLSSKHYCFFFLELLSVYEAGHFPCGWRGEWPRGKLVVY